VYTIELGQIIAITDLGDDLTGSIVFAISSMKYMPTKLIGLRWSDLVMIASRKLQQDDMPVEHVSDKPGYSFLRQIARQ
jgi:hypothetical protein